MRRVLFFLLILALWPAGAAARSGLYQRLEAASVEVLVNGRISGSGAIVTAGGRVVSAAHVFGDRTGVYEVVSPGLGRQPVRLLAIDRGHDLALLQLPQRTAPYPTLQLAKRVPEPPTPVFLFGTPMYRHGVLLSGHVARSKPAFEFLNGGSGSYVEVVYVSAAGPLGMSGGPWVDEKGRLVGLQSLTVYDRNAPAAGVVSMAPVEAIGQLVTSGKDAHTPTLGLAIEEVWEQPVEYVQRFPRGTSGLMVARLHPGGPAARAGLVLGDLIVAADGEPVGLRDELMSAVRAKKPGQAIRLSVLRPGQPAFEATITTAWLESR